MTSIFDGLPAGRATLTGLTDEQENATAAALAALSVALGGTQVEGGGLPVTATGGTAQRSLAARAADVLAPEDFGAVGDGSTNDSAALADALAAAAGRELIFTRTYRANTGGLVIPDGTTLRFLGKSAKVDFRGTGACFEVRNAKNVTTHGLHVDMTSAGAGAIGLHVRGLWFGQMYQPRMVGGAASHTGIFIETSYMASAAAWGAYLLEIHNPDLTGTGAYGIRADRASGDTGFDVTHLNVYGGWSKGFSFGLHWRNVSSFKVRGFVSDTHTDGLNMDACYDGVLEPGELGPGTRWGINLGASCAGLHLLTPSMAGVGGTSGYLNTADFVPQMLDQGVLRLYASRSAQDYYFEAKSIFNYGKAFVLNVRQGDGSAQELLSYGHTGGLVLNSGGLPYVLAGLPTSSAGLPSGALWRDAAAGNVVKAVP